MPQNQPTSPKQFYIAICLLTLALAAGLWFARNLSSPAEETKQRLETTKAAVLAYVRDTGEIPPSLRTLVTSGYLDESPENRSGHPLVFAYLGSGRCEIKSLGPDGEEGGFMFKRDHSITFQVPLD